MTSAVFAGCIGQEPAPVVPRADILPEPDAIVLDAQAPLHRWNGTVAAPEPDVRPTPNEAICGTTGISCPTPDEFACFVELTDCRKQPAPCSATSCWRTEFQVAEPQSDASALVLSVRWPSSFDLMLDAWIEDPSGAIVAYAPSDFFFVTGQVAALKDPQPGTYVAVVGAVEGTTSFQAAVRLESHPSGPVRELLPDLTVLAPTDLTLETPDYVGASFFTLPTPLVAPAMEAAGTTGCRADEAVETAGRRCLRFSMVVANQGEGVLEIRLPAGEQQFTQLLHSTDGTTRQVPVGNAEWHASHAHWHNAAANLYTIHPYDPDTGVRDPPLNDGKKGGVCFADFGLADVGQPWMAEPAFFARGCFYPDHEESWSMGMAPGWYDMYPLWLSDQYVDLTDVPDGTYQLCTTVNMDGLIVEADPTNNQWCTAFQLAGNEVTTLDEEPYYASME